MGEISDLRLRKEAAHNRLVAVDACVAPLVKLIDETSQGGLGGVVDKKIALQHQVVCSQEASAALDRVATVKTQLIKEEELVTDLQRRIECLCEERMVAATEAEVAEKQAAEALKDSEASLQLLGNREADLEMLRQE